MLFCGYLFIDAACHCSDSSLHGSAMLMLKFFISVTCVSGSIGGTMSIVMNLYYCGKDGSARTFAEEMENSGVVEAIRAEEGNERYEYFYPKNDSETVLLIDAWRDQSALDAHHASPMMDKISELRSKYNLHMRAERYVSGNAPISDERFIVN